MTLALFTKPLAELVLDDVNELVARKWPEGHDLEYKQALPGRDGAPDPWVSGRDGIGRHARDEILAEVVAFANAQGGTVVLGIGETGEPPARAEQISPIPRAAALVERFEDAARSTIDPPLQRLELRFVQTDAAGRGVLLFRVPASHAAPHRLSTTGFSYVRRQASTVRMTMREIQDMTLNVARGLAGIEARFRERKEAFQRWMVGQNAFAAYRVTALPLVDIPDPGRLFGKRDLWPYRRQFTVKLGTFKAQIVFPLSETSDRPSLRGVMKQSGDPARPYQWELQQSGLIDVWVANTARDHSPDQRPALYHGWVMGGLANVLLMVQQLRNHIGMQASEYGIEMQINRTEARGPVHYIGLRNTYDADRFELPTEISLPRLSVGRASEFADIIAAFDVDIFDALGARRDQPDRLEVEF